MLQFRQTDTAIALILTLTELATLTEPNFLFAFTHVVTKDVVAFVKTTADDESNYADRYNQFTIDPSTVFAGMQPGEWHYAVYEQESADNLDPALATGLLETGKTLIGRDEDFAYDMYDSPTTFKVYNG